MSLVNLDRSNKYIAKLTLDSQSNANALSLALIDEIVANLSKLDRDEEVRVIILTGEGKFFSAGGDVKKMRDKQDMFSGDSIELQRNYEFGIQQIPRTIENMSTPLIAMVNGAAIGAGCDLACMCDMRIASDKAMIGHTFSKLSLVPGDGGTYFLPRVVGFPKAMEMLLTSKLYNSDECLQMGLVNFVYDADKLEEETMRIAQGVTKLAPNAVRMTKKALKHSWHSSLNSQLDLLSAYQGIIQNSKDHHEGLSAFFDKRDPDFSL